MTTITPESNTSSSTATSPTNDGSTSWLKKRSSIFNNNTITSTSAAVATTPKVVDKELARLKNVGALSSVWSNKFVQEDNSGGTIIITEYKRNSSLPLTESPLSPPLSITSPRQKRFDNFDVSPVPNSNYIQAGITNRVVSPPPPQSTKSPRSSVSGEFNSLRSSLTSLSGAIAGLQQDQQAELKNNFGYFSKNSVSSSDLNENEPTLKDNKFSVTSSVASSVPSSPVMATAPPATITTTASTKITTTATPTTPTDNAIIPSRSPSNSISSTTTSIDEAASLWFQCETLKTQYAQSNARLNRANEDIEFYKRQLEQQGEVSRQGIATVVEEKENETLRVRQLAELIVKQDKLLGEYEINLDFLVQLTNVEKTQAELDDLRQESMALHKQKELMEGAITALRAELEMSYSQMRLMMVVSTEIQNEFDSYKEKINLDIKDMLIKKQVEHEAELKALEEKLSAAGGERLILQSGGDDHHEVEKQIAAAIAAVTATAAVSTALVAADNEKALASLCDRITTLTKALEEKDKTVSEAVEAKDKAVQAKDKAVAEALLALSETRQEKEKIITELQTQLKNQKMSMDAQMMVLNQTILEKDNLLMEFMSSRNNSREVISAAASMSSSSLLSSVVPAATVTDTYYHQQQAHLQVSQIHDYMFSSSDEEEDEEAEVMMMSYTTDEDEDHDQEPLYRTITQQHGHYHRIMNTAKHNSAPQSPADTVSSSISFDSDEEEEKIAEIKHFSYSSVPPTPPPSDPLPPIPVLQVEGEEEVINFVKEESVIVAKPSSPIANLVSTIPPPRRARSKTMARNEAPNMSVYTTSVHRTNELPRIIPLQKTVPPVAPPRKDQSLPNLNIAQTNNNHTKWMDDPESSEEDEWCEATNDTPKQSLNQEWNIS